jgi:hypothetical protein
MKNLFLLTTEKPSRLLINKEGTLVLTSNFYSSSNPQNIYITNSEEIKEGDWVTNGLTIMIANLDGQPTMDDYHPWKKIILTTDSQLIADGVQAIDDDFLEWFVKNPSCESVEIKIECTNCDDCNCQYHDPCLKPKYNIVKDMIRYSKEEPKQETLEETAENFAIDKQNDKTSLYYIALESFKDGAKWQQEQDKKMYSEEEVENILIEYVKTNPSKPYRVISWFEQFKKK